jgi:hypothetical protein
MKTFTVLALLAASLPAAAQTVALDGAWRCTPSVRRAGYDFCVDHSPGRMSAKLSVTPNSAFIIVHAVAAVRHPSGVSTREGVFTTLCRRDGVHAGVYQVLSFADWKQDWKYEDLQPGTEPDYSAAILCSAAALKVSK